MQSKVLELIFKHRYSSFSKECLNALSHQEDLWKELLDTAQKTEFGQKREFEEINSLEKFKEKIPISSYENLAPEILRMKDGEENVLWPGQMQMFAKSSGTSNSNSKFIPLSKASLSENHFKGGKDILSIYCHHFPNSKVFDGKNVSVAGSFDENDSKRSIGDLSSLLLANLPPWVEFNRLPNKDTALLPNWETKIEKISTELIDKKVASLSGVPSWNLILLNKVLEKSGKRNLKELWPNFQLYMHGGVNFEPYKESFKKVIGPGDFTFLETYNASEGFFAIQDEFNDLGKGMNLLCNHGVFYEFLPLSELEKENKHTLQLNEVNLNESYALVISTKSGLWRYLLGDTVCFTAKNPYRIKLTGRVSYFINVFGEELMEDNVNQALNKLSQTLNCTISEFSIGPIFPDEEGKGGHEWLIEFDKEPDDLNRFAQSLDNELKKLNSDYETKRSANLGLQAPMVRSLPKGTFYNWLKSKGKMGGQHKVPRLQNHRKVVDEISEFITAH